jgi:hypothetical protein
VAILKAIQDLKKSPNGGSMGANVATPPNPKIENNAWVQAMQMLDRAASHIKLEPWILDRLRHCKRVLQVALPVKMDDGSVKVFEGYRVQHNLDRGPPRAASATIPRSISTRSKPWPSG